MTDNMSVADRSRTMSRIRSKNTKPEIEVRKGLFRRGMRYKLHDPLLPGKPDIVFPRWKTVVFVHGCFWHAHDCQRSRLPKSNLEYWRSKIVRNVEKDECHRSTLQSLGWKVILVWECQLKKLSSPDKEKMFDQLMKEIKGEASG